MTAGEVVGVSVVIAGEVVGVSVVSVEVNCGCELGSLFKLQPVVLFSSFPRPPPSCHMYLSPFSHPLSLLTIITPPSSLQSDQRQSTVLSVT